MNMVLPFCLRWPSAPWLRRAVQFGALTAFLVLLVVARRGGAPPSLANLPMRLDPLTALAHALAARILLPASALALLTLALTLLLGRAWCGWLCPLGTLLDLVPSSRPTTRPVLPETWRRVKHFLWLALVIAALLGNLTLLVLDPLTLLIRTFGAALWPALERIVTATEVAAYTLPPLRPVVGELDRLLRPAVFPVEAPPYRTPVLYALTLTAVLSLNALAPRFWCRYLCPLGGLLGVVSKVALVRREVTSACTRCGACARVCPTGTIHPDRDFASDPAECTMCLECLEACPYDAIRFPVRPTLASWETYDPNRRTALTALGVAVAGVALFRSSRATRVPLIRPPGARENDLEAKCIRCGLCVRSCPTGAIQPALLEGGLESLWTPVVIPRLGYCDYSCNACGQVCPVEAIPPLSLEEKRRAVLGRAYVDRNRCIPWADHRPCIVCEEMCPVPEKAIILEEVTVADAAGQPVTVQRPHVVEKRCIGCGICEYKCPVSGEAAIRVFGIAVDERR
ncbi:MAG: 4Fe-4S binding protein [Anaerolineae bacterium]|nr:4Fe-4S binding protein [Anaerolineae bacterium]MCX8066837.1 4Fe-4S binding protein [Anaerolineae bacterium]MDW7992203.1 4Fe-4S binding protein [Anaerolineae bacterium]